jgi:polyisoprenoid-binding protein YceI
MQRVLSLATLLILLALPTTPLPAFAQSGTWQIDSNHTAAQFSVRHLAVSTVRGTLGRVTGTAQYDGKNLQTLQVEASIDVAGLDTGVENRDNHLRSADFFDVANHPAITFKSKRAEAPGDGRFRLVGDLTIRGTTKEVVLEVEGPSTPIKDRNGLRTGITATTRVNRKDFGLMWDRLTEGVQVVADEIRVTIDAELVQRSAPPGR